MHGQALASLPGNIDAGGDLDWDGGDYIYSTHKANGSNGFIDIPISGNSWTNLALYNIWDERWRDLSNITSSGYISALRVWWKRDFARYDIVSQHGVMLVTDILDVNDGSALVLYITINFATPAGDEPLLFIVYDLSTNRLGVLLP
ncbi:MAG: hypothetical protein IPJ13_14465, partial [Saprospiraceae bacterium]|nr:hypothetical protein [Saprospiraceae bacterium]